MEFITEQLSRKVVKRSSQPRNISTLRYLFIPLNERCPLKCKHCSVGFSSEFKGSDTKMDPEQLQTIISSASNQVYGTICFVGGEPSLVPDLIRVGIEAARTHGFLSSMTTAPVWAASPAAAERFLNSVPGLNQIVLSLDWYHLDFLKIGHYENAIRAASARGMAILVTICYTKEREIKELTDQLSAVIDLVTAVGALRTLPVGNAATSGIEFENTLIENVEDLGKIQRGCVIGYVYVDKQMTAHGCCWSVNVKNSPFSSAAPDGDLSAGLRALDQKPLFKAVRGRGFIDSLSAEGKVALADLLRGRSFSNECHVCLTAQQEGDARIWSQCGVQ